MEQILVFNLVNNEAGQNEPDISIHGRVIFAVANNILIRRQIPEGGLGYAELWDIAETLRVRRSWLAEQLNHPRYNGIAGPIVAEVAQINRMDVNRVADHIIYEANRARVRELLFGRFRPDRLADELLFRRFRPDRLAEQEVRLQPRIEAVEEEEVADDETCAICLQEKQEEPALAWVTAVGCTRHKFHRECLVPWRGNYCMTCRAPLTPV
jgi:hypothetical protein